MKKTILTKKEEEIMREFWDHTEPLGFISLSRLLPEYNPNTMRGVLRDLKKHGYLKNVGTESDGITKTRTFVPCISETEYAVRQIETTQIIPIAEKLIESVPSLNDLEQLKAMIEKREEKLGGKKK